MDIQVLRELFTPPAAGSFAEARLNICNSCERMREKSKTCAECNCMVPLKVRIASTECPVGKWGKESE